MFGPWGIELLYTILCPLNLEFTNIFLKKASEGMTKTRRKLTKLSLVFVKILKKKNRALLSVTCVQSSRLNSCIKFENLTFSDENRYNLSTELCIYFLLAILLTKFMKFLKSFWHF